jgi:hypothetical protein
MDVGVARVPAKSTSMDAVSVDSSEEDIDIHESNVFFVGLSAYDLSEIEGQIKHIKSHLSRKLLRWLREERCGPAVALDASSF